MVGAELNSFFAHKVKAAGGDPKQVVTNRFGSLQKVGGVSVTTVPAVHSNGLHPDFLDKGIGDMLQANGLTAYVGPPNGYVVMFTNGLVVYLSGDTGITAEQDLVVRQYYKANLAVINIGDVFTTGPEGGSICHRRDGQAQRGDLVPRQRGRHPGRQGAAGHAHGDFHEGGQGPGARSTERQDDGVRWQRQVHRGLLIRLQSRSPASRRPCGTRSGARASWHACTHEGETKCRASCEGLLGADIDQTEVEVQWDLVVTPPRASERCRKSHRTAIAVVAGPDVLMDQHAPTITACITEVASVIGVTEILRDPIAAKDPRWLTADEYRKSGRTDLRWFSTERA